jgi:hypothetical protein
MMSPLDAIRTKVTAQWGDKADVSKIAAAAQFLPYFQSPTRIRVRTTYGDGSTFVRTGRVSRSTGWAPSLLLVHRSNSLGSWDLLGADDEIIAVWNGRQYVDL